MLINNNKEETVALNQKLAELTGEELEQVTGGTDKSDIIVDGIVVECLPNFSFRVELKNGHEAVAHHSS